MKRSIVFCLYFLSCFWAFGQTREQDVDFITGPYLQNIANDEFKLTDIYTGGYTDPASKIKYLVEIKRLTSADNKNRGLVLVYYELLNNEKNNKKVYCIPVKGSDGNVEKRCLRMISDIADGNELRVMLWALGMSYSNPPG
jgi:hypothetical protein